MLGGNLQVRLFLVEQMFVFLYFALAHQTECYFEIYALDIFSIQLLISMLHSQTKPTLQLKALGTKTVLPANQLVPANPHISMTTPRQTTINIFFLAYR